MFQLREPYTPPIFIFDRRLRRRDSVAATRVGDVRVGGGYTDSNEKPWTFTDRADEVSAGTVGAAQRFVATTDAYPDSTYKFYEPTEEALTATVESLAKSQALSSSAVDEWSVSVEETEGPIVSESDVVETMARDGVSEEVAFETMVKKAAAKAPAPKAPPTASGGASLKAIQTSLMTLGYDLGAKYGADGKIGPFTRGAIVKFKKDHSLSPADATINEPFRKALAAAVAEKNGGPALGASAAGSGATIAVVLLVVAAVAAGVYFFVK